MDEAENGDFSTEQLLAKAILAAKAEQKEADAKICEAEAQAFLSTDYASNQPLGSFCERFA